MSSYKYRRVAPGQYIYDETEGYTKHGLRITIDKVTEAFGLPNHWNVFVVRFHEVLGDDTITTLYHDIHPTKAVAVKNVERRF